MKSSGSRPRSSGPFRRDRRGVSETTGFALILVLTVLGATIAVGMGSTTLSETRTQSAVERAEHEMTLFDSHAATVALGDSDVRSVSFGQGSGSYNVDPDAGHITITHANYTGGNADADAIDDPSIDDPTVDDDYVLYSADLGSVTYREDDASVAYQGGGVWRRTDSQRGTMVSPPEFHYRGATLTLPVVLTRGSDGQSGSTTARIKRQSVARSVYPNASDTYPSSKAFLNPSKHGEIVIRVESEYAHAWGDYFKSRTQGVVSYPSPNTVTLTLISAGFTGPFTMPSEGDSLEIRGLAGGHNLNNFQITLRPDDTDSASFSNLQWSFYAERGQEQLEVHLDQGSGHGCSATADLTIYYSADGGTTYESWEKEDAFTASCSDLDGDGDDEVKLDVDFTGSTLVTNQDYGGNLVHFSPSGATRNASVTFDQHPGASLPAASTNEAYTYADGQSEEVGTLMSHYLALMGPGIELTVDDKTSNSVNEGASYGQIYYPPGDQFVTYLHVTENEITVEFD